MATNPPNTNDSTVAGFISPSVSPAYDKTLDVSIGNAIAGICNLPGNLVRPRLQPEPASQPPATADWCAFGVVRSAPDWADYEEHDPTGEGTDVLQHDELLEVLVSFFGPNASLNEATLRVGLQIGQNRVTLSSMGLEFMEQRGPVIVPSLIKNIFVRRVDTTLVLRRRAEFVYPIRTIVSAEFGTQTDVGVSSTTTVSQ